MSLPTPVKTDVRICFGIHWFATEKDAEIWGNHSFKSGNYYNGGYYHGRPCGRDKSWDYTDKDTGESFYAATF